MRKKPILASSPRFWSWVRGHKLHERSIIYMSLNQDSVCDCSCVGCFRYPERKHGLQNLLDMEDYKRLIPEFVEFGGLAIEMSGEGEPLLSDNTLPIIRLASGLGLWTTLITNGHLLTENIASELRSLNIALVLSLHSMTRDGYERDNQTPGTFETKMDVIRMVSEVFAGSGWRESGHDIRRTCIHWTLQADNIQDLFDARRMCDESGCHFSIASLAMTGHAKDRPDLALSAQLEEVNQLGDESIIFYDEPDGRVVCGTCRYGLNIGADGKLLLDAHGGYEAELPNIRDISFEEATELQKQFSVAMFSELDSFCPVRDGGWQRFLDEKRYKSR